MKMIYMLWLLILCPVFCEAQVTVTPQLPAASIITKDQVWNAVVANNSPEIVRLRIQVDIRDIELGNSVLNAYSGSISVGKGIKIIQVKDVQPVVYNYLSNEMSGNFLPCGNYQLHYKVIQETDKGDIVVADDVQRIAIRPLSPPMLVHPADKTVSENLRPQFSWVPPTPLQMYNPLLYDFKIVKIEEGQVGSEAVEMNVPVYYADNLVSPALMIPSSVTGLEKAKKYAWYVVAKSGMNCYTSSAVHEFYTDSAGAPPVDISSNSYIKMKRSDFNKGLAPGGILKFSYINEMNEKEVVLTIKESGSTKKILQQRKISLVPGENLFTYDAGKKISLKEGLVYELQIENAGKETWSVWFECTGLKK